MGDIGDIVKTVEQGIAAGDFQITGKPTMSTDGVPEAHGVQPGEEDARDKALDADPAAAGPPRPAPPSGPNASEQAAEGDVQKALAANICNHGNVIVSCDLCQPRCGLTGRCFCTLRCPT